MATVVHDLDLPEIDFEGLERADATARLEAIGRQHWLARNPLGYSILLPPDVTAILAERRFRSALALLTTLAGVADPELAARQQRSILAMEGPEHTRLRRLVAPAFTPRSADRLR